MKQVLIITLVCALLLFGCLTSSSQQNQPTGTQTSKACYCSSCSDCTDKLNDQSCSIVYLNQRITANSYANCIDNPTNFTSKILDCQGNTIEGNIDGTSNNGIDLESEQSGDTINNCTVININGKGIGINLNGVSKSTLTNNNVLISYIGIYLGTSSNNNTITNNAVNDHWYGIYLNFSSNNNILTNNVANSNGGYGIYLFSSSYNALTNNAVSNADSGIYLDSNSNSNTITNNTVNKSYFGIDICSSSSNNTLRNNNASYNSVEIC